MKCLEYLAASFLDKNPIQNGFMTAHTGPDWVCPTNQDTPLQPAERCKFEKILIELLSPDRDYSIKNYLIDKHQFSGEHAQLAKETVDAFCYMLNDCMDRIHKEMLNDNALYKNFHESFSDGKNNEIRQFIFYSQHLDRCLIIAKKSLQSIISLIEGKQPLKSAQNISEPCSLFIMAITDVNRDLYFIISIYDKFSHGKFVQELKSLKQKIPEYTQKIHTLERITEAQAETNRNLTARIGKGVITQKDMAKIIVKAGKKAQIDKYEHCTRETISHWENNRGCPPWYSKSFRLWEPAKVVEMTADAMKEELVKQEIRNNLNHPLSFDAITEKQIKREEKPDNE